ncbi:hypothetical protein BMG05_06490 [Mycobacterium malmoense]|nr:hypothetical protein BMG05_06490 [Mycobacterium malmoense]
MILHIETANKPPLSFPCDTFTHWHDNLRAITLTLEALRKVDRYGVTQTGQQYRGWQAIEATPSGSGITVVAAIERLADLADMPLPSTPEAVALAYRRARAVTHPDRNGGDHTGWYEVEKLADFLRREERLSS